MKSRIDKLSLADLIPFGVNKYYRYPGSLTTPGCDEVVEWYVVDTPILKISNDQILDFQSIEDQNGYPVLIFFFNFTSSLLEKVEEYAKIDSNSECLNLFIDKENK